MLFDDNLLSATVLIATPLLFAGAGELLAERAGIMNIGLEGMMLVGAFFGFWIAFETGSVWLGAAAGAGAGLVMSAIMALAAIEARADQIVVGLALILLAIGLTSFLNDDLRESIILAGQEGTTDEGVVSGAIQRSTETAVTPMSRVGIPGLEDIPGIGNAIFRQPLLVYLAFALVPIIGLLLARTRLGLGIRAAGDFPEAADTAGMSVRKMRWLAELAAGLLAGLGGVFLSLAQVGTFTPNMTAGRGFLALSAVIFGAWRAGGMLLGCLVFALAEALQLRLQGLQLVPREVWVAIAIGIGVYIAVEAWQGRAPSRDLRHPRRLGGLLLISGLVSLAVIQPQFNLPAQAWLAAPFIVTIVALATLKGRRGAPRFLGVPYTRGAEE